VSARPFFLKSSQVIDPQTFLQADGHINAPPRASNARKELLQAHINLRLKALHHALTTLDVHPNDRVREPCTTVDENANSRRPATSLLHDRPVARRKIDVVGLDVFAIGRLIVTDEEGNVFCVQVSWAGDSEVGMKHTAENQCGALFEFSGGVFIGEAFIAVGKEEVQDALFEWVDLGRGGSFC